LTASVNAAIGRPATVTSGGADIERVSGHTVLMCGLSTMAGVSSNTNAPEKLLPYAQRPAATIAAPASQTLPSAFGRFPLAFGDAPALTGRPTLRRPPLPTLDR
jgi:hypothetical protein